MNSDVLKAIADLIDAIDNVLSDQGLTLSGVVRLGDANREDALGALSFNDGSPTKLVNA